MNYSPNDFASALINEIESLPDQKTKAMRNVRQNYSKSLIHKDKLFVFEVAEIILSSGKHRWVAYELIGDHPDAFHSLCKNKLEELGSGINSWYSVDSFSRTLSGPAWKDGLISADAIRDWAHSDDRWWRRASLVSTVALNIRSHGGEGDTKNTLAICEMLVNDHDDMVVKALSWALRELVVHNPKAVSEFIFLHEVVLAPRVKREVSNKLKTGLKNP